MMDLFKKCLIVGSAFTAVLFLGSLAVHQGSSYLGMQAAGFAQVLASSYPGAVCSETFKVLLLTFTCIVATLVLGSLLAGRRFELIISRDAGRRKLAWRPLLGQYLWLAGPYTLVLLASFTEYPALYESYLGASAKGWAYQASWHLNPAFLRYAAAGLTLGGFLLPRWRLLPSCCAAASLSLCLAAFAQLGPSSAGALHASSSEAGVLAQAKGLLPRLWPWSEGKAKAASRGQEQAPDILLIAVDSLRYDRSMDPRVSPFLHALRDEEPQLVTFHDHQIGIPRTFPSWVEVLRGSYAARSGIRHMFPGLARQRQALPSLASKLTAEGYDSAVFSDFAGDIFPRLNVGFQHVGAPHLQLDTLIRMGVAQRFPLLLPFVLSPLGARLFPSLLENPAYADPQRLAARAQAWMAKRGATPQLTTVFFSTAHFPYAAPWPWYQRFTSPTYPGPYYFQKNPQLNEKAGITANDIKHVGGLYDGAVASVDAAIADLVAWLKAEGRWDNTLLVVTADHGEDLFENGNLQGHGEHLRGDHVLHVPLLIKLPTTVTPGRRQIAFTSRSIDLTPTLLALAGSKADWQPLDGVDLSPWIRERARPAPSLTAYAETGIWFGRYGDGFFQKQRVDYPGINDLLTFNLSGKGDIFLKPQFETTIVGAKHRALVKGPYKIIYEPMSSGAAYQLYNRQNDPSNQIDLSASEPTVLASLKHELWQQIAELEGPNHIHEEFVVPE